MSRHNVRSEAGRPGVAARALLLACLIFPSFRVSAQVSARERARAEVVAGARFFQQGKFEAALDRFQKAYGIFPSGKVYYNMALAYRGMGKPSLSVVAAGRFLRDPGDSTPELLAEARALLEEQTRKVSLLTVLSDSEGAEILLDGNSVGQTPAPAPIPVDPGRHEIVLRSPRLGSRTTAFTAFAARPTEVRVDFGTGPTPNAAPVSPKPTGNSSARPLGAAEAEALIRQARELRSVGKDARAYPLLQRAYEAETTPRTAAQLGLVEMQLGYWIAAERHLAESLSAPRDPWIAANRADLEGSLVRVRAAIGEVVVNGTPAGARVSVNGWVAGTLPLATPIRAGEGPLNVDLSAPGFAPLTRSLTVVGGQRQEVQVSMTRLPEGGAVATTSFTPPPGVGVSGTLPDPADGGIDSRRGLPWRPIGWTAAVLGAGAVGVGIWQNLEWRRNFQKFENYQVAATAGQLPSAPRECGAAERNRGAPGCDRIYKDMERSKKLAIAGYAAGGLFAAGALAALLLSSRPEGTALACAPSAFGGSCQMRF
jgi:tetratricopeptide (TPR) repeat protein